MSSTGFPFFTAQEARILSRKNIFIFNEIRSIENSILQAIDNGLLETIVTNTAMTDTLTVFPVVNVSSINISTDVITSAVPHALQTGDVLVFQSTGNLPFPITSTRAYYAHVLTPTTFKLNEKKLDAVNGTNFINIQTSGSGTIQFSKQSESMRYYLVWKEYLVDNTLKDRMEQVINYFKRLGYGIARKTNPTTNKTFQWEVSW